MLKILGYRTIHIWIKTKYGKAGECENPKCPKISETFDWALIHGKPFVKKRSIFKMLCRSCHMKYDKVRNPNITKHGIKTRFGKIPAWNKGLKTGIIPKTSFKKGLIPWNKGKHYAKS